MFAMSKVVMFCHFVNFVLILDPQWPTYSISVFLESIEYDEHVKHLHSNGFLSEHLIVYGCVFHQNSVNSKPDSHETPRFCTVTKSYSINHVTIF